MDMATTSDTGGTNASARARWTFHLDSLLLMVTALSVALGLGAVHWALGLAFAALAIPAGIRTAGVVRRRTTAGSATRLREKCHLYYTSLKIVLAIWCVSLFALVVTAGFVGSVVTTLATWVHSPTMSLVLDLATGAAAIAASTCMARYALRDWWSEPLEKPAFPSDGPTLQKGRAGSES
jgi:hypothetical protein